MCGAAPRAPIGPKLGPSDAAENCAHFAARLARARVRACVRACVRARCEPVGRVFPDPAVAQAWPVRGGMLEPAGTQCSLIACLTPEEEQAQEFSVDAGYTCIPLGPGVASLAVTTVGKKATCRWRP
jgi:hypothetical protein